MPTLNEAIRLLILPFRIAWISLKVAWALIGCVLCLWLGAFLAYWIGLTLAYMFLPEAWTQAMWAWSSGFYHDHLWFRVATIAPFTFLVALPFAYLKDERTPEQRTKEMEQRRKQNDDLIAARQQEQLREEQQAAQELSRLQAQNSLFG
ncbi:hypothetical protein ABID26_004512 [Mesorhizobium shonense]|uniref:Uncharacterized protein n=1 Tax=Mesorhizobium shonense TaxID=1209948 RepID=A0ABV2HWU6_9HYPH